MPIRDIVRYYPSEFDTRVSLFLSLSVIDYNFASIVAVLFIISTILFPNRWPNDFKSFSIDLYSTVGDRLYSLKLHTQKINFDFSALKSLYWKTWLV